MPVEYYGINEEHNNVRTKIGVFDVSHMGEIWVKGPNALPFIQYTTSNDASVLVPGKVQYSCFPNGKGGIVDDLLVYCIDSLTYLLVVNASNVDKDYAHLAAIAPKFGITPGKELYNASDEICQLAVQGPLALKAMQKICDKKVEDMEYYTFQKLTIAGIKDAIFSTTGYTGSGGCEIYVANEDADKLWKALRQEKSSELQQWALAQEIHSVLRWDFAFMEMTLMIQLHQWKPVWDGLQNSAKQRAILLIKRCILNKKPKEFQGNSLDLK